MSEIKLVLCGAGGVGKSALTISFVSNVFVEDYDPTIEDSHRKQVSVDDIVSMLDILDTAGQEEYSSMQDQWFRQGEGFLVAYSIVNKKSFAEVTALRQKIERIKNSKNVAIVLVGNKTDLDSEREVSTEEGKKLAEEFGCPFFETSAKLHSNVDECFQELVREVRKRIAPDSPKKVSSESSAPAFTKPKKKVCLIL